MPIPRVPPAERRLQPRLVRQAGTVVAPLATRVQALAVDGKTLRGATAHGVPTQLGAAMI